MTHERPVDVHVLPPGFAVATYLSILTPPLSDERSHETRSDDEPARSLIEPGEVGLNEPVVISADASEAPLSPAMLRVLTVNVYLRLAGRAGTRHDVVASAVQV